MLKGVAETEVMLLIVMVYQIEKIAPDSNTGNGGDFELSTMAGIRPFGLILVNQLCFCSSLERSMCFVSYSSPNSCIVRSRRRLRGRVQTSKAMLIFCPLGVAAVKSCIIFEVGRVSVRLTAHSEEVE